MSEEQAAITNPIKKELAQPQKKKYEEYKGVKTTLFRAPDGTKHPIVASWSPEPIALHILNWLDNNGYCQILNIGQSGTGKTVWTKYLIHSLHMKRSFQVHHYEKEDLAKLDQIIDKLEVGINHIIAIDDASFILDQLKQDELSRIAQRLTYIRHDVKAQVVIILNIHYTKAIKRFFRNVPFSFFTSISAPEINSIKDEMGSYAGWKFKNFSRYWRQLMLLKSCDIIIDRYANKKITIRTNEPFRLGVANELNHIHYFVWTKQSCNICDPDLAKTKQALDSKSVVDTFINKYDLDKTRSLFRWYALFKHGIKAVDSKRLSMFRTLSDFDKNNRLDWVKIIEYIDNTLTKKRARSYIKKNSLVSSDEILKEIEPELSKDFNNDFNQWIGELFPESDPENNIT